MEDEKMIDENKLEAYLLTKYRYALSTNPQCQGAVRSMCKEILRDFLNITLEHNEEGIKVIKLIKEND